MLVYARSSDEPSAIISPGADGGVFVGLRNTLHPLSRAWIVAPWTATARPSVMMDVRIVMKTME